MKKISAFLLALFVIGMLISIAALASDNNDSAVFVLDTSETIVEAKDIPKIQKIVRDMNQKFPGYVKSAGAMTFGHLAYPQMTWIAPVKDYDRAGLDQAFADLKDGNGSTPIGMAVKESDTGLAKAHGKKALIIVSDGRDNGAAHPVEMVKWLQEKYPSNLCVYTILMGKNPRGAKIMSDMAAVTGCGKMTKDIDLGNDDQVQSLVDLIFGREAPPAPTPTGCSTTPVNGATKVSVTKKISASFDGPVANGSFIVTGPDQTRVKGTITYGKENKMATFSPDAPFAPNTTYVATIKMGAQSLNNNCVWSFTTAPVVLIELDDTHFAHDSSALTSLGKEILIKNIQTLKTNPTLNILVAGYTSASGSYEYNQKLSERRAATVRDALIEGGIAPERLTEIGYGKNRPAEYEPYPEEIESRAAQANRRVLFTVIVK